MDTRFCECMGLHDVTEVADGRRDRRRPSEVRDFVAGHGGRLFVWISVHPGSRCPLCLLETSFEPPRQARPRLPPRQGARVRPLPGGHAAGLAEVAGVRSPPRRRVEAYWNGLAWVA